jgi:hypothetical protein
MWSCSSQAAANSVHSRSALLAFCIVVWLGVGEVLRQATPPPSSPVDLVEVDVVGLQPPQAGLACCQDLLACEVGLRGSLVVKWRVGPAVQSRGKYVQCLVL